MIECSKCGKSLGEGEDGRSVPSISGEIMGDEDTDSWYFCSDCQVYTVEKYHDRFSGEDSVSVQGPVEKARGDARVAVIRRCPKPWSKRCNCPAHREYFGSSRVWPTSRGTAVDEDLGSETPEVDQRIEKRIAAIERENRPFWTRILREHFDRDVGLEIDWESFIQGSKEGGWTLVPLDLQSAGVERLLYALTILMGDDGKFRAAAMDRVESIQVASARDHRRVGLQLRKGRLTYRCFAGDWHGYATIDEIKRDLKWRVRRKSRVRKLVEGLWERVVTEHGSPSDLPGTEPPSNSPETEPQPSAEAPRATAAAVQDPPTPEMEPYDPSLRVRLEALYDRFLEAIAERDLEALLSVVEISRPDEGSLRREVASDGLSSFAEWMLSIVPPRDRSTFVSLKSDDGLAGYYMAWLPSSTASESSSSDDYLNLTLLRFVKAREGWRFVFPLTGPPTAILQVRKDEHPLARAQEVIRTNPLMKLKPTGPGGLPEKGTAESESLGEGLSVARPSEEPQAEEELSVEMALLKEEFQAIYRTMYRALEDGDVEAFLSTIILSESDQRQLRERPRNLMRAILEDTPEPADTVFVALTTRGEDQAGFYFVAPYPQNPSFDFVYLRPFLYRQGRWQMVFGLEYNLAMNMSLATSGGDLPSRAIEVITKVQILDLETVMTCFFDNLIPPRDA